MTYMGIELPNTKWAYSVEMGKWFVVPVELLGQSITSFLDNEVLRKS